MDELTGLPTHLDLKEKPPQADVGAVFFDIDGLKWVNDHFGFAAADDAIVHVANVVNTTAKEAKSLAYRVGGEEFLVLAPADGASLAHRVVQAVSDLQIPYPVAVRPKWPTVQVNALVFVLTKDLLHIGAHGMTDPFRSRMQEAISGEKQNGPGVVALL